MMHNIKPSVNLALGGAKHFLNRGDERNFSMLHANFGKVHHCVVFSVEFFQTNSTPADLSCTGTMVVYALEHKLFNTLMSILIKVRFFAPRLCFPCFPVFFFPVFSSYALIHAVQQAHGLKCNVAHRPDGCAKPST